MEKTAASVIGDRINSFEPIVGESPLLLILGSIPGKVSLESGRYYDNERNHFWRLMCYVLKEPKCHPDYVERVAMLKRRRIALWDSVGSCVRAGSLDRNIREERPNDIPRLMRDHPTIRAICFNGRASEAVYCRHHAEKMREYDIRYLLLPSSSPVPRKFIKTFEDKLAQWIEIRRILDGTMAL
ncbi:MAG: DNA-deoxyinosine glycosylase [Synergistaceae bacterium]|jgi:TDG/mug DNA glycosylase family protein|nr:DNA-deoxyinosine glycosylase [Synergistaceae bacterium]